MPWVAEFNQLARESREADRPLDGEPARRRRTAEFPAGTPLSSRRVRAFLERQPWDHVDLPMICRCIRSVRRPG